MRRWWVWAGADAESGAAVEVEGSAALASLALLSLRDAPTPRPSALLWPDTDGTVRQLTLDWRGGEWGKADDAASSLDEGIASNGEETHQPPQTFLTPKQPSSPRVSIFSPLGHVVAAKVASSGRGTHAALSVDGSLYLWGSSGEGQCGVEEAWVESPRRLPVHSAPDASCPHGQVLKAPEVKLVDVALTESRVVALDEDGRLWTWGGAGGTTPRPVEGLGGRRVRSVHAGKDFFAAVAYDSDPSSARPFNKSSSTNFSRTASARHGLSHLSPRAGCDECRREEELRLSRLMELANEAAEEATAGPFPGPAQLETPRRPDSAGGMSALSEEETGFGGELKLSLEAGTPLVQSPQKAAPARRPSLAATAWDVPSSLYDLLASSLTFARGGEADGGGKAATMPSGALSPLRSGWVSPSPARRRPSKSRFSFVSMELLASHQDSTPSASSNDSLLDSTTSPAKYVEVRDEAEEDDPFDVSLWTWGSNNWGQLGLGDTVPRTEPCRVELGPGVLLSGLWVGAAHCVALTGTGQALVWGRNDAGQVKQVGEERVVRPRLLRVGSQSLAVAAAAARHASLLLVNGHDNAPALYFCGPDQPGDSPRANTSATALRLSAIEKKNPGLWTGGVWASGGWCAAELHAATPSAFSARDLFAAAFAQLRLARDLQEILTILQALSQEGLPKHRCGQSADDLSELGLRTAELLRLVAHAAHILTQSASSAAEPKAALQRAAQKWRRLVPLIQAQQRPYLRLLSQGLFSELSLSAELEERIEKLSVEHGLESQKPHRRLRRLLLLPALALTAQAKVVGEGLVGRQWASLAARLNRLSERTRQKAELAEATAHFWRDPAAKNLPQGVRLAGRLILQVHDRWYGAGPRGLLNIFQQGVGKLNWQHLIIASDGVIVTQRRVVDVLAFPLVWLASGEKELAAPQWVSVMGAEAVLSLEFDSGEARRDFAARLSVALQDALAEDEDGDAGPPKTKAPTRRRAAHLFGPKHALYPSAHYQGLWVNGKPHGRGKLSWADGRVYEGRFHEGKIHGLGVMASGGTAGGLGAGEGVEVSQGVWREGRLEGLAVVEFADGSVYEGYLRDGKRHGHGVQSSGSGQSVYVGGWAGDVRQGYGVATEQRHKYLGRWEGGKEEGRGTLVTIDGLVAQGLFRRGLLVQGRLTAPDGLAFQGDLNGLGVLAGKGVLTFPSKDQLEGTFSGSMLDGSFKVSSGTYSRFARPASPRRAGCHWMDRMETAVCPCALYSVEASEKWAEVFGAFEAEELGQVADAQRSGEEQARRAWDSLAAALTRLRQFYETQEGRRKSVDPPAELLECVPAWREEWGPAYHGLAKAYFAAASELVYHPLARLSSGVCDVFATSYSTSAAHEALLGDAVAELRSLARRLYATLRLLFPNLPHPDQADQLLQVDESEAEASDATMASTETVGGFVLEKLLKETYPVTYTLVGLWAGEADAAYARRLSALNAKSDVALLAFFDIPRHLWPLDVGSAEALERPLLCATARSGFYESAIGALQGLAQETTPRAKLLVLAQTFAEVNGCVSLHSEGGRHVWSMDDLYPVFLYVVVRAGVPRLGAELGLMELFLPQLPRLGQLSLMFTTLKASYYQILREN